MGFFFKILLTSLASARLYQLSSSHTHVTSYSLVLLDVLKVECKYAYMYIKPMRSETQNQFTITSRRTDYCLIVCPSVCVMPSFCSSQSIYLDMSKPAWTPLVITAQFWTPSGWPHMPNTVLLPTLLFRLVRVAAQSL